MSLGFLSDMQIPERNRYIEDIEAEARINESTIKQLNSMKNGNYFV